MSYKYDITPSEARRYTNNNLIVFILSASIHIFYKCCFVYRSSMLEKFLKGKEQYRKSGNSPQIYATYLVISEDKSIANVNEC